MDKHLVTQTVSHSNYALSVTMAIIFERAHGNLLRSAAPESLLAINGCALCRTPHRSCSPLPRRPRRSAARGISHRGSDNPRLQG
jgi:hypothetical protein